MNKLKEKLKSLSIKTLKDTLIDLQSKSGPEIATVWLETCNELEERMGEDEFWSWADDTLTEA